MPSKDRGSEEASDHNQEDQGQRNGGGISELLIQHGYLESLREAALGARVSGSAPADAGADGRRKRRPRARSSLVAAVRRARCPSRRSLRVMMPSERPSSMTGRRPIPSRSMVSAASRREADGAIPIRFLAT